MSILQSIIRYIRQRCDNCGSDVQGDYVIDSTFGKARTCCIRASK